MRIVLEQVFILVFSAAAGYGLCRAGKLDSAHAKTLSALQVYIFLPCTLFNTYSTHFTIPYIREKYTLLVTSFIILLILLVLGNMLAKALTKQPYLRSIYRYSLIVSNYGGFGYPLIGALYGSLMLQNAMLFSIPISLYTYTAGYAGLTKTDFSLKRLLNPVMTAILLGAAVGLTGLQLPAFVTGIVSKFAACMAPVGMLTVGMVVSEFDLIQLRCGRDPEAVKAGGVRDSGADDVRDALRHEYHYFPAAGGRGLRDGGGADADLQRIGLSDDSALLRPFYLIL